MDRADIITALRSALATVPARARLTRFARVRGYSRGISQRHSGIQIDCLWSEWAAWRTEQGARPWPSVAEAQQWRKDHAWTAAWLLREHGRSIAPQPDTDNEIRKHLQIVEVPATLRESVEHGKPSIYRGDENVESMGLLFFDSDDGVTTFDALRDALDSAKCAYLITDSSTAGIDGAAKWHCYLPLSEPLMVGEDPATFKRTQWVPEYAHVRGLLQALAGVAQADGSVDDLAQPIFVPTTPDGCEPRRVIWRDGKPLDWDALLLATRYLPPAQQERSKSSSKSSGKSSKASSATGDAVPEPTDDDDGGETVGQTAGSLAYLCAKGLGLLGHAIAPGKWAVRCPWCSSHSSGEDFNGSTVVLRAGNGYRGSFVCSHAHCADRDLKQFLGLARSATRRKGLGLTWTGDPLPDRPEWGGAKRAENRTAPEGGSSEADQGQSTTSDKDRVAQPMSEVKYSTEYPNLTEAGERALIFSASGPLRGCPANVTTILRCDRRWLGVLSFNDFSQAIEKIAPLPNHELDAPRGVGKWEDADTDAVRNWMARYYGLHVSTGDTISGIQQAAIAQHCHPIREYLDSIRWDGIHRLPGWLSRYLGAQQSDYTARAGTYWMIAAVARVMQPGCQSDHTLILEGKQGAGKSSALRILGGAWYRSTKIDIHRAPDCYQALRGVWLYEMAELASFKKADGDDLKSYLTDCKDSYRDSYGRGVREYPRQVVFAGTVNPDEARGCTYLSDPTGGRRFWPVKCFVGRERADLAALSEDRDQLWAEAAYLYSLPDARWWPTPEEEPLFLAQQAARSTEADSDPWDETIADWLAETDAGERIKLVADDNTIAVPLTATVLLEHALRIPAERRSKQHAERAGRSMRRMGWRAAPKAKRVHGTVCKPFERSEDGEEGKAWRSLRERSDKILDVATRRAVRRGLFSARYDVAMLAAAENRLREILDKQG